MENHSDSDEKQQQYNAEILQTLLNERTHFEALIEEMKAMVADSEAKMELLKSDL